MVAAALATALLLAAPAGDPARELRWRLLKVDARLDARGDLRVIERQVMVLSGDWNGGERTFRLPPGQRLRVDGLLRLEGGREELLAPGNLDEVGRWALVGPEGRTLRWRSRAPGDPPYRETELTYVLVYTLSGVVRSGAGGEWLHHDFAFADRPGPIEEVQVLLELDRAWGGAARTLAARDLPPGQGVVLHLPLPAPPTREAPAPAPAAPLVEAGPGPVRERSWLPLGERSPSALDPSDALGLDLLLAAALVAGLLAVAVHDQRRGRFGVRHRGPIDEAWLARNLFRHPAERAAIALGGWDAERRAVEAVLTRMESSGDLRRTLRWTRAHGRRSLLLELLTPRAALRGSDRTVADVLFASGNAVAAPLAGDLPRYPGADPAPLLAAALRRDLAPPGSVPRPPLAWPGRAALLLLLGGALLGADAAASGTPALDLLAPLGAASLLFACVHPLARRRAVRPGPEVASGLALLAALGLWAWLVHWTAHGATAAAAVPVHALAFAAGLVWAAGRARSLRSPEEMAAPHLARAARRHLRDLLEHRPSALRAAWMPYLVALGLQDGLAAIPVEPTEPEERLPARGGDALFLGGGLGDGGGGFSGGDSGGGGFSGGGDSGGGGGGGW